MPKAVRKEEQQQNIVQQMQDFVKQSIQFYIKCKKPDRAEYMKILQACIMGFFVMGAIGYFIKLVFIPINNIILSWSSTNLSSFYSVTLYDKITQETLYCLC